LRLSGGYRLKIIGWDRKYDNYRNRKARFVYRNGEMLLMVTKRVPKPEAVVPRWVLAVDINERYIYYGNGFFVGRIGTAADRILHCRLFAENLQRKCSSTRYNAWLRRRRILDRIRCFYWKARNIVED